MLVRGALKRCAVCGQGRLFRRWFTMLDTCPRCGLKFERIDGHWVGSLGINTIVTFGSLLLVVAALLITQYPDYDVLPLTLLSMATTIVVPIFYFPFSRTLWTAIDLVMRPVQPWEVDPTYLPEARRVESPPEGRR